MSSTALSRARHPGALAFLTLLLAQPGGAQEGVARFVPPVPTPASFISDARGVLPAPAHAALDSRIRALQDSGFGDIAVAILPSIGDYAPVDVGVAIYRAWKVGSVAAIGSAHRDVGVLILIVPKELAPNNKGQCWITTGTGSEGMITDAASGAICRDQIIPHLIAKDYQAALAAGIETIAARLRNDAGLANPSRAAAEPPPSAKRGPIRWWQFPIGFLSILAGLVGGRRWRRNRPRRCPNCGRMMSRLSEMEDDAQLDPGQRVEERVRSVNYDVWACQCGEHLVIPYRKIFSLYSKCPECGRRTEKTKRRVVTRATTVSTGLAEDTHHCEACGATRVENVVLARIQTSSGSSGSSGGGGGGSSFGGSGSTSGGGGGSSY